MKNLSFIKSVYFNFEKFTDELFDETTIQDDEFMKLFFIECKKTLKSEARPSLVCENLLNEKFYSPEVENNKSDYRQISNDIPCDYDNVSMLTDLAITGDVETEKPIDLPLLLKTTFEPTQNVIKKFEKVNLAIMEGFNEMPGYVQ